MTDAAAREIIRTDLDHSMIVEAAAGTGKTTELVARMIHVLESGRAQVGQLAAVTFTEKAAGELKLRLRSALEAARAGAADDRARDNLSLALAHLEEAHLNTIHGFCLDLLRERPVEAAVDPGFTAMDEDESERLYGEAFDAWFERELDHPREGVRRALARSSEGSPADRLLRAGLDLLQWRDLPVAWRRDAWDRAAAIRALLVQAGVAAALAKAQCPLAIRMLSEPAAAERGLDDLEARFVDLARDRDKPRIPRGAAAAFAELMESVKAFARAADADLAALLREEIRETLDGYARLKQDRGKVDFLDLLLKTRDLLRDHDDVRGQFQRRFTHLFIDEFQDTDPLQAEILLLLAADDAHTRDWREITPVAGKLFLVGDPKQAIYRFRRADVAVYQEVKDRLGARGVLQLTLNTSFRSVPAIQNAVNAAFAAHMDGDQESVQAGYVPLSPYRPAIAGQPAIVALSVPEPYGKMRLAEASVERCLPDTIGNFVDWIVNASGWKVEENGTLLPLGARHICLLFRKTSGYFDGDITRAYVNALEARGIPHLLVGGKTFHSREEVESLRASLAAIEWPDDELSVYATLRGPLFAVNDELLLDYRDRFGPLHPFRIHGEGEDRLSPIIDTLSLLRTLHRGRNRRPVASTIDLLLSAVRAHAALVLRPSGEQVLANALHVSELARQYEERGGISFRGFVERLNEEAEKGVAADAPILEEGSDGVRLMTVHKAKGLEFPVVILTDVTTKIARKEAARFLDQRRGVCAVRIGGWSPADLLDHEHVELSRDNAEGVRLAYVAATRARDLLVVPTIGDDPRAQQWERWQRWWVAPLHDALYPAADARRSAVPAAGCPHFGTDSVALRPDDHDQDITNIAPGEHTFANHKVIWWDPRALPQNAREHTGLRHHDLLSKDFDPLAVERDLANHRSWSIARAAALETGARPALRAERVTRRAEADAPVRDVEVISTGANQYKEGGPGFGALVHAVISLALAGPTDIPAAAGMQARVLGCTPAEADAAASVVAKALAHPFFERVRRAGQVRSESPVIHRLADGTMLEGVVDLAFEEAGQWIVADFKTDREIEGRIDIYKRQVSLYADAVAAATGQAARGILIRL